MADINDAGNSESHQNGNGSSNTETVGSHLEDAINWMLRNGAMSAYYNPTYIMNTLLRDADQGLKLEIPNHIGNTVYAGTDRHLASYNRRGHNPVVVKMIIPREGQGITPSEIKVAALLQGQQPDWFVGALAHFEIRGLWFMMMPKHEESLSDVLQHTPRLIQNGIPRVATQLFRAVEYLHCSGIAHRDIKPSNMLVVSNQIKLRLCDFGMSMRFFPNHEDLVQSCAGTPGFQLPEMMLRMLHFATHEDIWALGVTIYRLYALKPPFIGMTPNRIIKKQRSGKLRIKTKNFIYETAEHLCIRLLCTPIEDRVAITELLRDKYFTENHDFADDLFDCLD